jgi:hypothetical protein
MSITVRPTVVTVRGGSQTVVRVDRNTATRIAAGVGPRGPAGQDAAGATLVLPTATSIHAGRAVRLVGGELSHPSTSNPDHAGQVAGVAETAAASGATARIRTAGVTENDAWTWAEGPVFVGHDGVLTQTPPSSGWLMTIGRALTATSLLVDIEPPIYRS